MPSVYGYCRVSTQRQADQGDSLEVQEARLRSVFELEYKDKGYQFAAIVRDSAESGGKPFLSRPGGAKLVGLLEKGDIVVFPKLDRGFRNTLDCLNTIKVWKQVGVVVRVLDISVDTSTPIGEMILTVMAAVAQFERQRLGERVREVFAARRRARAAGETDAPCSARPPYGLKTVKGHNGRKKWVPDTAMRELGSCIVRWRDEQQMTWHAIWLHLLRSGVTHVWGGKRQPWNSEWAIRRIYAKEKALREQEALDGSKSPEVTSASPLT